MRKDNPTVADFHNDMNQHGNADYKRVAGEYVLELESYPVGWRLTVWRAVKEGTAFVTPDIDGNRYHWDAVGQEHFNKYDSGKARFDEIGGRSAVSQFCDENPYDGPRTPYHKQD